jgi:hypothetical protein
MRAEGRKARLRRAVGAPKEREEIMLKCQQVLTLRARIAQYSDGL